MANDVDGAPQPDRSDNHRAKNILSECPYEFANNAYTGGGGFKDGYYLVPGAVETMYAERRQLSTYKNYIAPIVSAMVNPVFSKDIEREVSGEPLATYYNNFIKDCNLKGDDIDAFMKEVATKASINGVVYIIIDNVKNVDGTIKDNILSRSFPYLCIRTPKSLVDIKLGKNGSVENVVFCEGEYKLKDRVYKRYKRWFIGGWEEFYRESDKDISIETGKNNLNEVPVIAVWRSEFCEDGKPIPFIYSLARQAHSIFNIDSERREVYRKQGFSLFYYQSDSSVSNLTVGAGNSFRIGQNASIPPGYASMDPNIPKAILEESKDMRDELYRIAEQNGVKAVESSKSGIAKEWDFIAYSFALKTVSDICKKAEDKINNIFAKYIGATNTISVSYPDDFTPKAREQDLNRIQLCKEIGVTSSTARAELEKASIRAALPFLEDEYLEIIDKEIDGYKPINDAE